MVEINAARAPDPWRPPGGYKITVRHTMIAVRGARARREMERIITIRL